MSTEREVVEHEILKEHMSIFSPEAYKSSLALCTRDELIEECFKQYTLSGEMLSKYRRADQQAVDYRKQRDDEKIEVRRWRSLALQAQTVMHEAVAGFGAIQHIEQESAEYTHNAKSVARRLVHGIAQNVTSRLKAVLENLFEAQHTAPEEFFDLPF